MIILCFYFSVQIISTIVTSCYHWYSMIAISRVLREWKCIKIKGTSSSKWQILYKFVLSHIIPNTRRKCDNLNPMNMYSVIKPLPQHILFDRIWSSTLSGHLRNGKKVLIANFKFTFIRWVNCQYDPIIKYVSTEIEVISEYHRRSAAAESIEI